MSEVLKFNDSRISFDTTGDLNFDGNRLNRYERYEKHLLVDGVVVFKKQWIEDSDWQNCSEPEPSKYEVWEEWIKSKGLEPKNYK